jgi:hypothetical protein
MQGLMLSFMSLLLSIPYQAEATCDPNIPDDMSGGRKFTFSCEGINNFLRRI